MEPVISLPLLRDKRLKKPSHYFLFYILDFAKPHLPFANWMGTHSEIQSEASLLLIYSLSTMLKQATSCIIFPYGHREYPSLTFAFNHSPFHPLLWINTQAIELKVIMAKIRMLHNYQQETYITSSLPYISFDTAVSIMNYLLLLYQQQLLLPIHTDFT